MTRARRPRSECSHSCYNCLWTPACGRGSFSPARLVPGRVGQSGRNDSSRDRRGSCADCRNCVVPVRRVRRNHSARPGASQRTRSACLSLDSTSGFVGPSSLTDAPRQTTNSPHRRDGPRRCAGGRNLARRPDPDDRRGIQGEGGAVDCAHGYRRRNLACPGTSQDGTGSLGMAESAYA